MLTNEKTKSKENGLLNKLNNIQKEQKILNKKLDIILNFLKKNNKINSLTITGV